MLFRSRAAVRSSPVRVRWYRPKDECRAKLPRPGAASEQWYPASYANVLQVTRYMSTIRASRRNPAKDGIRAQSPSRSEEHTSELQSLMRISYAVFCLKKNNK